MPEEPGAECDLGRAHARGTHVPSDERTRRASRVCGGFRGELLGVTRCAVSGCGATSLPRTPNEVPRASSGSGGGPPLWQAESICNTLRQARRASASNDKLSSVESDRYCRVALRSAACHMSMKGAEATQHSPERRFDQQMPRHKSMSLPDDQGRVPILPRSLHGWMWACAMVLGTSACGGAGEMDDRTDAASGPGPVECTENDSGLVLPSGFCATVFADELGAARHVAARSDGTVFVVRRRAPEGEGGIVALRDGTGDGVAELRTHFGPGLRGTGIALTDSTLYMDAGGAILRFSIPMGAMEPTGPPDTIVRGLPRGGHDALSFTLDGMGGLFVNIGSRTNACQEEDRAEESPGLDPCPELDTRAGIWRFSADEPGQRQESGTHWATGIRNAVAVGMDSQRRLWAVQHGRDQLHQSWSRYYSAEQNAGNPAEELLLVARGDDFGWPYCYFSREHGRKVLAPEYGGTGLGEVGRCAGVKSASATFPAHWAPMSLLFYTGDQFPPRYRSGVFVAFHGSWNRGPLPQQGFNVVFLPMGNGDPAAEYEVFADGFAGGGEVMRANDAVHRPVGLAQASDGGIYVTDDRGGRMWKITYRAGS